MFEALTIEAVEFEFATWRAAKRGHEAIPEVLWEKVGVLLKSHRVGEVLRRLHLSHGQLKAKGLFAGVKRQRPGAATTFVEVPALPAWAASAAPSVPLSPLATATKALEPISTLTLSRGDVTLTLSQPTDAHVDERCHILKKLMHHRSTMGLVMC